MTLPASLKDGGRLNMELMYNIPEIRQWNIKHQC
jgi:hypothetical protein